MSVHMPHMRSVLGRQFIRSRYTRSASQQARSQHMYGSFGATHRENKRWNQKIYSARRRRGS